MQPEVQVLLSSYRDLVKNYEALKFSIQEQWKGGNGIQGMVSAKSAASQQSQGKGDNAHDLLEYASSDANPPSLI